MMMKSLLTGMMLIWTVLNGNDYSNKDDDDGLMKRVCKNTPNYQLCVSVLSNESSSGVNVESLGVVMVDAVKGKAEEMIGMIRELERSKPVEWRLPLSQCYFYYYAVVHADVPKAQSALKRGVPKFAVDGMDDAALEAHSCHSAFINLNYNHILDDYSQSPISHINNDLIDLSAIATSIIKLLL